MPSAIRIEGLTKDFAAGFWRKQPRRALDGLTLAVAAGEVYGFLGPNGAGKTTTLKLLMQLLFPTAGRVEILGRPAGALDLRRRIGFPSLAARGVIASDAPTGPAGVPYVIDPVSGQASVSRRSPYFPLPVDTRKPRVPPRPGL